MKPFNRRFAWLAVALEPLWSLLGLLLKPRSHGPTLRPNKILIFEFHLIGDVVLLTPLLRVLREAYPAARTTLVAGPWAQELLCAEGLVDEIVPFSAPWVKYHQGWRGWLATWRLLKRLRRESWDMGVEVRGDVRQILLLALAGPRRRVGFNFTGGGALLTDVVPDDGRPAHSAVHHRRIAEYLGIWPAGRPYLPLLRLTDDEAEKAKRVPRYTGIHLGASRPLKMFPLKEASDLLEGVVASASLPAVIFSGPGEPGLTDKLIASLRPSTANRLRVWSGSLREFVVMASRADRFFCMDSGPAHIAAALGVPVTIFFGPTKPATGVPLADNIQIVENNQVACRPCYSRTCANKTQKACFLGLSRKWRTLHAGPEGPPVGPKHRSAAGARAAEDDAQ